MHKHIILILSLYAPLYCMESLITTTSPYCFENLTVFNYDGNEDHALFIAKTAELVHSNPPQQNNVNNCRHPNTKNLFLRSPQGAIYDRVTVYDPYMLNKKNIDSHLKNIHNCLTPSGKFCGMIRTQTNNISIPEQAFFIIYSQMRQLPYDDDVQKTMRSNYLTDNELKKIILANGYAIEFYENNFYETVIHNKCEYKKMLKERFIHNVRHLALPLETIKQYKKMLVQLIKQYSKRNNSRQIIECWNFTKITLCKADNPPIFLNNSLLLTELDYKNDKK